MQTALHVQRLTETWTPGECIGLNAVDSAKEIMIFSGLSQYLKKVDSTGPQCSN